MMTLMKMFFISIIAFILIWKVFDPGVPNPPPSPPSHTFSAKATTLGNSDCEKVYLYFLES